MPEILTVLFSDAVILKLWEKHRLMQSDVERVLFSPASRAAWDVHPHHGGRVIVRGKLDGWPLFVSLRPIDPERGAWECITAFVQTRSGYGDDEEGV